MSVSEPLATPSSSVFGEGHLKRDVGLRGLTLISLGSIIGSGWLLGALGAIALLASMYMLFRSQRSHARLEIDAVVARIRELAGR